MSRLNRLTRLYHWLRRSFWLLPMLGCLAGIVLAILAHRLDSASITEWSMGRDTVSDLLATIAGATATMMSLTYTLTLVIFTLAAGQLGPRLLDSFYDNRVNQVTLGTMGLTLTFALVGLFLLNEGANAQITGIAGIVLIVLSIGTLIYFVHDVAQRILIDNEIARTAKRLDAAICNAFVKDKAGARKTKATIPEQDSGAAKVIHAHSTGYLRSIDVEELVNDVAESDAMIEIVVAPGDYIVAHMPVALVQRQGEREDWAETVNARLVLGQSRSSEGDALFSANLLVEIALRALSPGINDSYTAISVIDHVSGALCDLLRRQPASSIYSDDDGIGRVRATALTVETVVDTALHPIRRNATGNLLVSCALLKAIERMIGVSDPAHLPLLRGHARLVAEGALPDRATEADRDELARSLATILPDNA